MNDRFRLWAVAVLAASVCTLGCSNSHHPTAPPGATPRTFRMGFSAIPPRPDPNIELPMLEMSSARADGAIMHSEPPWDSLLAGTRADSLVIRNLVPLA